jgi:midasin
MLVLMQEEEKGIEMSADFEGKVQDMEKKEDEEGNSDEEEDNEEEPDKEMGETDAGAERLDQQVSAVFESCWHCI